MNKLILSLIVIASMVVSSCGEAKDGQDGNKEVDSTKVTEEVEEQELVIPISGTYQLDSAASVITWRGDKSAKVDFHTGSIAMASGDVIVENDAIIGGDFTFDIGSIYNVDTDASGKTPSLAKHLKNEDFFDQDNHGMPKFSITKVENGLVTGYFTMRSVTQEISFEVTTTISENEVIAQADSIHIPMTGFGMTYYEEKMKPTIIIGLNIVAIK
jgi:polyisoprenoid-binding protein YceI